MAGDAVGELCRLFDPGHGDQRLGRDALVEFDVLLELRNNGAHQRFHVFPGHVAFLNRTGGGLEVSTVVFDIHQRRARLPLDQHLHGAIGQLQQLQHRCDGAERIKVLRRRAVFLRILLCHQQDLLLALHHRFEGRDRLIPADEQRNDHVRENDDVLERQNRIDRRPCGSHVGGVLIIMPRSPLIAAPAPRGGRPLQWCPPFPLKAPLAGLNTGPVSRVGTSVPPSIWGLAHRLQCMGAYVALHQRASRCAPTCSGWFLRTRCRNRIATVTTTVMAISSHFSGRADVAKLVDALDLGSSDFGRGGSSPFIRTKPAPTSPGNTARPATLNEKVNRIDHAD